jgi:large repetitive protein
MAKNSKSDNRGKTKSEDRDDDLHKGKSEERGAGRDDSKESTNKKDDHEDREEKHDEKEAARGSQSTQERDDEPGRDRGHDAADDKRSDGLGKEKDAKGGGGDDVIDRSDASKSQKINGGGGDDEITGSAHKDKINGGGGDDVIDAGAGHDRVNAGGGDDFVRGGEGNDKLYGNGGYDTAVYSGSVLDFAWREGRGNAFHVKDMNTADGDEGRDTLKHFEALQFDDYTLKLGENNAAYVKGEDVTTDEDSGVSLSFTALDFDCGKVSVESISVSGGGSISLVEGSTPVRVGMGKGAEFELNFEPGDAYQYLEEGESVTETVTVVVSDGQGAYTTKTFEITIEGRSDAPAVVQPLDAVVGYDADPSAQEDGINELTGQISSTGGEGEKSFSVVSGGALGALTVAADGSFAYALDNDSAAVQALAEGESIVESFQVEVTDAAGNVDTVTVELTVSGTNDAPTISSAGAPATATGAAPTVSGQVQASDIDNGDVLSYAVEGNGQGSYGSITMDAETGAWEFTADTSSQAFQALGASETATQQFVVEVSDGKGGTAQEVISIEIAGSNEGPVIEGVSYLNDQVAEDGVLTASGQIQASDADANDSLSYAAEAPQGSYGALEVDAVTGEWTYSLDNAAAQSLSAGEVLTEEFVVSVTDEAGEVATSTVSVTITGTNDAPVISSTGASATPASEAAPTLTGSVAATDVDTNDVLSYAIDGPAAGDYGNLEIDPATGDWVFTADANAPAFQALGAGETATQSFTVSVSDGQGGVTTQELVIEVTGSNSAPELAVVSQDTNNLIEDGLTTASGKVQGTDADANDSLAYAASGASYGSASVDADGNWSYALNNDAGEIQALGAGETLTESFEIIVTDAQGVTDTVTIELTITGTNDAPEISSVGSPAGVSEESLVTGGTVVASDVDANDVLSYAVQDASNDYGAFSIDPATGAYEFTLDPNSPTVQALGAGDVVTQDFVIEVSDGKGGVTQETVSISITGGNVAPVIDSIQKSGDPVEDASTTVTGSVIVSDADAGDTQTFAVDSQGAYGTAAIDAATGEWTYDLANASPAIQALGAGETLTESFVVSVTDAQGAVATEIVELTITGSNDAPVVTSSDTGVSSEDTPTATGQVIATDIDANDVLNYSATSPYSDYGSLSVNSATGEWEFTLNQNSAAVQALGAGESVTEEFEVTVSDGKGGTTTAIVPITIEGTNAAPVITGNYENGEQLAEDGGSVATGRIVASDADANDTLSYSVAGGGSGTYGSLAVDASGNWTYTVDQQSAAVQSLGAGESATEEFTVEVADPNGGMATTTVKVWIAGTNDAPVASSASPVTAASEATPTLSGQVVASDVDANDTLSYAPQAPNGVGTHGTLTVDAATGAWDFALNPNAPAVQALGAGETASEDFVINVSDGRGGVTPTTVTITIEGTNDAPVITQSTSTNTATFEDSPVQASGLVQASDLDGDAIIYGVENAASPYGAFVIDAATGEWTYTIDSALEATQALSAGEILTQEFTVTATDALGAQSTTVVTVTVGGSNDAPVIENVTYADGTAVTEQDTIRTGQVIASDVDALDVLSYTVMGGGAGTYGSLSLDQNGNWTYTADDAAIQALGAGETATDTFTIYVSDGSGTYGTVTTDVSINLEGTNSDPVVSEVWYNSSSITEDSGTYRVDGYISASDPDANDRVITTVIGDGQGTYGSLYVDSYGSFSYTVDNTSSAVQGLGAGETVEEFFYVQVSDGNGGVVSQRLSFDVVGVNDDPTVSGITYNNGGVVQEDGVLESAGTINVSDLDAADSFVFTPSNGGQGQYGSLVMAPNGDFRYTLNNDAPAVQALDGGEFATETFTVDISDGNGGTTSATLSFSIEGAVDIPMTILDFEGMYAAGKSKMPKGYGGFDWDANTWLVQGINYGGGWDKGTTSGKNAMFDAAGNGMSFTRGGDVFDFEKLNIAAANELSATAVITGLRNGQIVGVQEVEITRTESREVYLDDAIFDFVDEVRIDGAGPVIMDDLGFYL